MAFSTAFQANAFQNNAFQIAATGDTSGIEAEARRLNERGFDETLAAFARERRREREEREVRQFMDMEAKLIMKALKPFLGEP